MTELKIYFIYRYNNNNCACAVLVPRGQVALTNSALWRETLALHEDNLKKEDKLKNDDYLK